MNVTARPALVASEGNPSPAAPAWRKAGVLLGLLVVVTLVGWLDYVIGLDLRLYPLYMPPIAVAAWKVGAGAGAIVATASVGAWVVSHWFAGQLFSPAAWVINSVAHTAAFATIIVLVSFLRRSHAEEQRLAHADSLTGLANPRSFMETAEAELERQRRFPRPLTIAYIDLDNFKVVNDRFGHRTGDEVLSVVARALRRSTRATDHLARLGGDEFAVLMPETDQQGARTILERASAAVASEMAQHGWPVSCSVGAVVCVEAARDVDELVGRADSLMYQVKQSGKNAIRIELATPEAAARGQLLTKVGDPGSLIDRSHPMPRSTHSTQSFDHAARLLEDAFFLEEDRVLRERLRAMQTLAETKEALSSVSGITNDVVLTKLVELNVKPETVAALAAVPLVEVAWADGKIDAAERETVLAHANGLGIAPGSVEHELLERWLTHRPEPELLTAWQTCLKGLCETLDPEERVILREELLHATRATAEAAGGFLGLGRISSAEKEVLESLTASFCS